MRRTILRLDATFLVLAGLFGLASDLLSYTFSAGPFGATFYENPTVIGVVEAHALAVLTGCALWFLAQKDIGTFGNWMGGIAHLIFGVSNLIWFEVFTRVQSEVRGVAITAVHFAFFALNAAVIVRGGKRRTGTIGLD